MGVLPFLEEQLRSYYNMIIGLKEVGETGSGPVTVPTLQGNLGLGGEPAGGFCGIRGLGEEKTQTGDEAEEQAEPRCGDGPDGLAAQTGNLRPLHWALGLTRTIRV